MLRDESGLDLGSTLQAMHQTRTQIQDLERKRTNLVWESARLIQEAEAIDDTFSKYSQELASLERSLQGEREKVRLEEERFFALQAEGNKAKTQVDKLETMLAKIHRDGSEAEEAFHDNFLEQFKQFAQLSEYAVLAFGDPADEERYVCQVTEMREELASLEGTVEEEIDPKDRQEIENKEKALDAVTKEIEAMIEETLTLEQQENQLVMEIEATREKISSFP